MKLNHDIGFNHILLGFRRTEKNSAILKSAGHPGYSVGSVKSILLAGIETPDPVYFCTIEAPSETSNVKFEKVRG